MRNGSTAGFRYFAFQDMTRIVLHIRGTGDGEVLVRHGCDGRTLATLWVEPSESWTAVAGDLDPDESFDSLYFIFEGSGAMDFRDFILAAR